MKKINRFIIFGLVVCLCASLMSCNEAHMKLVEARETSVLLVASEAKGLHSEVNKDIKYWEFRATPQFTQYEDEQIWGRAGTSGVNGTWVRLDDITTEEEGEVQLETSLGRYSAGNWLFEVRALNDNEKVLAIGHTTQIIREGLENLVNVTVYVDRASGVEGESQEKATLRVGFEINQMDENINNMQVRAVYQKVIEDEELGIYLDDEVTTVIDFDGFGAENNYELPNWYTRNLDGSTYTERTTMAEGRVFFTGTLANLDAGPYVFSFYVEGKNKDLEWVSLGGQSVDVMMVGGETTTVKGTMLANEYILGGLKIIAPGSLLGTLTYQGQEVNYVLGTAGTPIDITYVPNENSAEVPIRYNWYVNGQMQSNTSDAHQFSCPQDGLSRYIYGKYTLSCVPIGQNGSIGSFSVDLIFNPVTGINVGEYPLT